jgi:hypothetical protein
MTTGRINQITTSSRATLYKTAPFVSLSQPANSTEQGSLLAFQFDCASLAVFLCHTFSILLGLMHSHTRPSNTRTVLGAARATVAGTFRSEGYKTRVVGHKPSTQHHTRFCSSCKQPIVLAPLWRATAYQQRPTRHSSYLDSMGLRVLPHNRSLNCTVPTNCKMANRVSRDRFAFGLQATLPSIHHIYPTISHQFYSNATVAGFSSQSKVERDESNR